MTGIYVSGLVLIGISAALLASHWFERADFAAHRPEDARERTFRIRQIRRRFQASALIGLVGLAMTLADRIPKNAAALSGYLFGLIIAALAILWLALSDLLSIRFRRIRIERERLLDAVKKRGH